MADDNVIGRINCPVCGKENGVRITPDRNGKPFGFCDMGCDFQMRIGGKPRRESAFLNLYPKFKAAFGVQSAPVTVTEKTAPDNKGGGSWLDNL